MSEFKPDPVLVLETREDVARFLASADDPLPKGMDRYRVESRWLESVIDAIEATGQYPYNSTVRKAAEQELGYPLKPDAEYSRENCPISTLVYNAQCYRRSNKLRAAGYVPLTQALIDEVGEGGKLKSANGEVLTIRRVPNAVSLHTDSKLFAFRPRKRVNAVWPQGSPVQVILENADA